MSKPLDNPEACFICRRRACGLAVTKGNHLTRKNYPNGWFCDDCRHIAAEAYAMADREFDVFEQHAMQAAGEKAGGYLDSIGKTDLATLSEAEWSVFLITMIRAFGDAIRAEVESGKAPF